mgnify:CR=1 FL=1
MEMETLSLSLNAGAQVPALPEHAPQPVRRPLAGERLRTGGRPRMWNSVVRVDYPARRREFPHEESTRNLKIYALFEYLRIYRKSSNRIVTVHSQLC